MRVQLILLFFGISLLLSHAQQGIQYSLYMMNRFNYNPAYAGLDYDININGTYRQQWVDLPGSPTSTAINAHMPLYIARGGLGFQLETDQIGVQKSTLIQLAYNYQLEIGNGVLALGLGAGFLQRSLDGSMIRTPDGIYDESNGIINHNDGLLPVSEENGQRPVFDVGVYYKGEWLEGGVSVRNVTEPSIGLTSLDIQTTRTYFATFSANVDVGYSFALQPSFMIRSDILQTQTEISVLGVYEQKYGIGGSLRGYNSNSLDAVAIIGAWNISDGLRLAYAYDLTISSLNNVSNGSHELLLTYRLNKTIGQGRPPRIIYHPRAF